MNMPPSGIDGLMDDQAVIEAEIYQELENINLDDEVPPEIDDDFDIQPEEVDDFEIQDDLDNYIKRLQDQSNRFEEELQECDELLTHTSDKKDVGGVSNALIPYEDHDLLSQLAREHGCDVEEYRRKILEDIENDEVLIEDELEDLIDDTDVTVRENGEATSITDDAGLPVKIGRAVEEGVLDEAELPVCQELVAVNGVGTSHQKQLEMQKVLKDELIRLESRYEDRMERMKKDDEYRKDEENLRQQRVTEERQWKKEEIQRQEKQMIFEREMAERESQIEQERSKKEMDEKMKQFEMEMAMLQAENEKLRREHEQAIEMEREKFVEKQDLAVRKIQRVFRGYRVRKEVGGELSEQREERRKRKEEERIQEVEVEIKNRKEEQNQKEEEQRQKKEEEQREKEEQKRQKELEKQRIEEEKKQKKLEEERIKQEEKARKEEEKRKKEEEKQKKKEEEKKRKEEEKRRKEEERKAKEEEEQRKKEEKKMKEEEEKQRKAEEKRKKEEEKVKLDAEKKLKEEELKKEQKGTKSKENEVKNTENERKDNEMTHDLSKQTEAELTNKSSINEDIANQIEDKTAPNEDKTAPNEGKSMQNEGKSVPNEGKSMQNEGSTIENEGKSMPNEGKVETNNNDFKVGKANVTNSSIVSETSVRHSQENVDEGMFVKPGESGDKRGSSKPEDKTVKHEEIQRSGTPRSETPRSACRPKSARSKPSTPRTGKKDTKTSSSTVDVKKVEENTDCLPQNLETLRLKFIEECLPWSKVSNEPWKLKAGLSRKPLRRPSSAKKLPPLPEDLIVQSAKVASLKMVTTVELQDLPGSNISPLGQCGGLKYLTLRNCNIVALDGLSLCTQLLYIDVQGNKIEYVDLKGLGQLQYLNMSQNKLSSIHGLDSCTNLRWLDLSHNNITRLGGMDTLRRLFCLKISHCQLISTQGLGATPTLQMLDVSHNHLQAVEDLDKLCLLLSLNASANNILQVPNLKNQVLLTEFNLSNNSISSLSGIGSVWLPVLCSLQLEQNSLTELSSLQNCLLLKTLNLNENQITDIDALYKCIDKCWYLEHLSIQDNPVVTDVNDSFYSKLKVTCPRFSAGKDSSEAKLKPRTSIEAMCITQLSALNEAFQQFLQSTRVNGEMLNQTYMCDIHYKFCDRVFNMAVEYRYSHEYGEVTLIPSAPTAPKSGRPLSARQREKFMNPKDMFENALKSSDNHSGAGLNNSNMTESKAPDVVMQDNPKDLFEQALKGGKSKSQVKEDNASHNNSRLHANVVNAPTNYSNSRDLFEQALKSADSPSSHSQQVNHHTSGTTKQSARSDKPTSAAMCIQAAWRGYSCRKTLQSYKNGRQINIDPALVERVYKAAVKIQASWRGYILRKKLLAALEYAQCDFDDDEVDEDMMDFGDEFDFEKFVDVNQDLLDADWRPPSTPDIPNNYAVLRKPPSGKHNKVPPINMADLHPPSNPRRAWRNMESPLSDLGGKIPRPPSSVASTELTMRSAASRKEERMAEEWGFKDNNTAHLMMERAKKMKFNSERRKKIRKLDPKQRLALFRKLEEVTHPPQYTIKQSRKTLPRKEYFQARQEEIVREEREKRQEYQVKASRTFEWLHSQVGDHVISDSVINQGFSEGPKYVPTENNLPELIGGGKRIHLVSSPMSIELQSVDSISTTGQKHRRFSAGSGTSTSKLPPIQPTSAPAPHLKERMSFRNKQVNQSVGWGGGKKRGQFE